MAKWKDIAKKYKDEWVLIEPQKIDENFNIQEGKIIAHSNDKAKIYEMLLTLKGGAAYIEYTGKIPDDLAVERVRASVKFNGFSQIPQLEAPSAEKKKKMLE